MEQRKIQFSPPDITEEEIQAVSDTLRSGWITTGPKTKQFEKEIAEYCGVNKAICLNSATAGLELVLRLFGIGEGDEVITTPYTYTATASTILHTGAKVVFADVLPGSFNIDPESVAQAITSKTKAVIPVDIAGIPCDYDKLKSVLEEKKSLYNPKKGTLQETLCRPLLLADAAHSFGAEYKTGNGWKKSGALADFSVFSFHAVKNLTTAEGGAVTFNCGDDIYKQLQLLSLHGQSKDALAKMKAGSWRYSIELPGYKCNMTDIAAAMGLVQLKRYPAMLARRKEMFDLYKKSFAADDRFILPQESENFKSSYHVYTLKIRNADEAVRDEIIAKCAENGVACNVHFIPLPMHPFYHGLGYKIEDYPNAYDMYKNEISLPVHTLMSDDDVAYVANTIKIILK
jgi:dTDP-4-amino-4,6-dideoxygalactose transaminase